MTLPKLETRSLLGVEILAPGTWNGDLYTERDLTEMAQAFGELKGQIDPPGKLGHDRGQALAQRDGFPAIGWVSKVYMVGKRLVADFIKVPAKVADLIEAGAYNKVSSEVYFDLEVDGKTYPRVLRAVAFLGADSPAVKDIRSVADVAQLYGDRLATAHHYADVPTEDLAETKTPVDPTAAGGGDDGDLSDESDYIAQFTDYCTKLEASLAGKPGVKRVRTFLSTVRKDLAGMKRPPFATNKESDMDIKVLAEALGLAADADEAAVLAAVKAAKETKVSAYSDDDFRKLNDQLGSVTKKLAETDATAAVDTALRAGKIAPAQVEWAKAYALKDAEGFKEYAEKAPKLAILSGPLGGDGKPGDDSDEKAPTAVELSIARQLGVKATSLERAKSGRPSAELAEEARTARETAGAR